MENVRSQWALGRGSLPTWNCNNEMHRGIRLERAKGPSHCPEVGWSMWDFSLDRWFGFAKAADIWMRMWMLSSRFVLSSRGALFHVYRIPFAPSLCDPEVGCPVGVGPPTRDRQQQDKLVILCFTSKPAFSRNVTVDGSRCCRMCCTSNSGWFPFLLKVVS